MIHRFFRTTRHSKARPCNPEQWTDALFDIFKNFKSPEVSNTEQVWTDFHWSLEAHMTTAFLEYEETRPTPHKRNKRSPPSIIPQRPSTYRLRRLQKLLGQKRELTRQHKQGNPCSLLEDNILRSWLHDNSHTSMATTRGASARNTWSRSCKDTLHMEETYECARPKSCIAEIQQYWSNIWQRSSQDRHTAVQIWKTHSIASHFPDRASANDGLPGTYPPLCLVRRRNSVLPIPGSVFGTHHTMDAPKLSPTTMATSKTNAHPQT